MSYSARPLLLLAAVLLVGAPFAYATEGENTAAGDTAVQPTLTAVVASEKKGEFKDSARFQEMLAKARAQLDQARSKYDKKVSSIKARWEKGTSVANVDASCVQKAVDTREVELQGVFNKSNVAVADALKARQTALYAAWGQSEVSVRNVALKDAWKAWTDARKAAARTLKTEREAAYKTFKTTVKDTCKAVVPVEDASAGSDVAGQVTI